MRRTEVRQPWGHAKWQDATKLKRLSRPYEEIRNGFLPNRGHVRIGLGKIIPAVLLAHAAVVFGADPETCIRNAFQEQATRTPPAPIPVEPAPGPSQTLDGLLEELGVALEEINDLGALVTKQGGAKGGLWHVKLQEDEAALTQLFENLSKTDEADVIGKAGLSKQISTLRDDLRRLRSDLSRERATATAARAGASPASVPPAKQHAASLAGFEEVRPNAPYLVPAGEGRSMEVVFTEGLLKDLLHRKVDSKTRETLLQAVKNGIVGLTQQRGIKLMKTFDKTPFAEVKAVGGFDFRIFGCVEGGRVILHFLGRDMTSGNDPQRQKIKALCR